MRQPGGIVKAAGLGDGPTQGKIAIAKLRGCVTIRKSASRSSFSGQNQGCDGPKWAKTPIVTQPLRLTMPPTTLGDFAFALADARLRLVRRRLARYYPADSGDPCDLRRKGDSYDSQIWATATYWGSGRRLAAQFPSGTRAVADCESLGRSRGAAGVSASEGD